ncbi:MAG: hypothetical protein RR419_07970, partial [Akkermansia sp.]
HWFDTSIAYHFHKRLGIKHSKEFIFSLYGGLVSGGERVALTEQSGVLASASPPAPYLIFGR